MIEELKEESFIEENHQQQPVALSDNTSAVGGTIENINQVFEINEDGEVDTEYIDNIKNTID